MKKHLARKKVSAKRRTLFSTIKSRASIIFLALLIGGAIVFFIKHHVKTPTSEPAFFSVYSEKIKTWLAKRKDKLHQHINAVKQFATKQNEDDADLHFEFYNTLPSKEYSVPISSDDVSETAGVEHKENASSKTVNTHVASHDAEPKAKLIDVADIENELSQQSKEDHFVVQLGKFKTSVAAEQYRLSLAELADKSHIIKMAHATTDLYRLQFGPFNNRDEAILLVHHLQRKGVNAILHKVEVS